jgi:predicted heme/steroid binding protein
MLYFLSNLSKAEDSKVTQITGVPAPALTQLPQQGQKTFTLEELSKYNGKNGNPAYVAVNRVIYSVTNNAAWAAATHFGLSAGHDLTQEFASCHAGQNILSKLKVVGRLANE